MYTLDTQLQTNTIFLNSSKANSRNPFIFKLNNLITCPTNMRMLISLEDFVISHCFNNVNTNNNKLSFHIKNTTSYGTITIPPGLYNALTFRDYINSSTLFSDFNIVCVYDKSKCKYSFASTNEIVILNDGLFETTCGEIIGLNKNDNNQFVTELLPTIPTYTIFMPSCVDFSGTPYIFLKCEEIIASNINSFGVINNCLSRIPVNSPYGYKLYYRPTETIKCISSIPTINSLTFYLEDSNNNTLDVGSTEFQLLIKISFIYTPPEKIDTLYGTLIHHMETKLPEEEEEETKENIIE